MREEAKKNHRPQQISLISSEAIYKLRYCNREGDAARKLNGKYNINKLHERTSHSLIKCMRAKLKVSVLTPTI